jgi:hypothetical protein
MSVEVTSVEKHETKSDFILTLFVTRERDKELLIPIIVGPSFLEEFVDEPALLFPATVTKLSSEDSGSIVEVTECPAPRVSKECISFMADLGGTMAAETGAVIGPQPADSASS